MQMIAVAALRFAFVAMLAFAGYTLVYDNMYRQDMRSGAKPDAIAALAQWARSLAH